MKEILKAITDFLVDKSTPFILLIASFVLVSFSIKYDGYFFESFSTLIYATATVYLHTARKHETLGPILVGTPRRRSFYTFVFITWFLIWVVWILGCSNYFLDIFTFC